MSTTSSVKPLQTLKGVFNMPKMNHGRDFLRENKLSLRDLQRVTTKNKQAQQQQKQRLTSYLPQYQQDQIMQAQQLQQQPPPGQKPREPYISRRTSSQQRAAIETTKPKTTVIPSISQKAKNPIERKAGTLERQKKLERRDTITGKITNEQKNEYGPRNIINASRCGSCAGANRVIPSQVSIGTVGTMVSRTESCDKEIQTEDIHDEKFLYDALQKCGSGELHVPTKSYQNGMQNANYNNATESHMSLSDRYGHNLPQHDEHNCDRQSTYGHDEEKTSQHQQTNYYDDNQQLGSARSKGTLVNGHAGDLNAMSEVDALSNHIENMAFENHDHSDEEPMLQNGQQSSRSRQTVVSTQTQDTKCSMTKKRSTGSVYKLGNREDVRLPRYLEREKREKAEQRLREMERDPNCPIGHFLLSEQERHTALTMAEKKFKSLINELNHMPMTTQTLRIRTRKAEIDKELALLEADIRIFSKPKVYVKEERGRQM